MRQLNWKPLFILAVGVLAFRAGETLAAAPPLRD